MIYAAAFKVFNKHLAYRTALIGIPIAILGLLLLVQIDLDIVRGRQVRRLLVALAVLVVGGALAFMYYRFNALKIT